MAYLLGSFGASAHTHEQQQAVRNTLQKAGAKDIELHIVPHGVIGAGNNPQHTRAYNEIFTIGATKGILVGKLFDREEYRPFTAQDAQGMHYTNQATYVYRHFWGRFVGALYDQNDHELTLVRDPLGLSTLFYSEQAGNVHFSTDMSLLYDLLETKPSLDFSFFAEYIINKNQALPTTPFCGITELLPGMSMTITRSGSSKHQLMWDITQLKGSFITNEGEMEEQLLATLKSSVKAWTHNVDGICVELSGGLDSSAVLITLREVLPIDKKLIAVNFIDSKTPSSNENEHAQEVADLCSVPLQLVDWHGMPLLSELPAGWLPNKPNTFLFSCTSTDQLHDFATAHGCSTLMNGQGGDHVFLAPAPENALADYWLDHGFKGITTPLKSISAAHRTSWPSLMYQSTHDIVRYYRSKQQQTTEPTPFLTPDYAQALSQHDFYLHDKLLKFYPARATQIQALAHAVIYADRDQRSMQTVMSHPLLSLPLVELALKIPTYQSFNDTYDRIFFRRAATKMKPAKSLWRTMKGQTTGSMSKSLAHESGKITDLLTQGTLVQSGVINQQWLTDELIKIRHGKIDDMWPLLHLIASQVWLNQWKQ